MKRFLVVLLSVALFTLVGCSNQEPAVGGDMPEEDVSEHELINGYTTFKEAIEKDESQVWYWVNDSSIGKNSQVSGVFVFENGTVTIYDRTVKFHDRFTKKPGINQEYTLGTISEYISLSNEDAIKLAKERFSKIPPEYVKLLKEETESFYQRVQEDSVRNYDDEYAERIDAIAEVEAGSITEREPYPYAIFDTSDDTGNNVSYEGILVDKFPCPAYYVYKPQTAGAYAVSSYSNNIALLLYDGAEVFEIYDYYVGGYNVANMFFNTINDNPDSGYFVTKCTEDAEFFLDDIGTTGIIDDPQFGEDGSVITEPN